MIKDCSYKFDIIFLLTIFTLSIFLFYPDGFNFEMFYGPGDETTYKSLAIRLVEEQIYAENFDNLRSWRPPGYPFYLSIFYFFFGEFGFKIVPYVNFSLYIFSFYLIFITTNFFFSKKISFYIVLIIYLLHFNKFNSVLVINYSEVLFFFLVSLFLFLIVKSYFLKKNIYLILSFFVLSLSYMVRGPTLPLGIIILFLLFLLKNDLTRKHLTFCFILFLIPCCIWMVRNYYILGFGPHLYTANYILIYYGLFDVLDANKIDEMVRGLDDLGKVQALKPMIIEKISDNYFEFISHYLKKILKHFYYHNTYIFSSLLVIFSFYGFFFKRKTFLILIKERFLKIFLIGLLISLIFIMISSMAQFSWRYSLIPSSFKLLFELSLITYFIKFKSYVFFKKI